MLTCNTTLFVDSHCELTGEAGDTVRLRQCFDGHILYNLSFSRCCSKMAPYLRSVSPLKGEIPDPVRTTCEATCSGPDTNLLSDSDFQRGDGRMILALLNTSPNLNVQ